MKDKFPGCDNYSIHMRINPDIHGFVSISALSCKNGAGRAYRVTRTMEYTAAFGPIRDRMLAGLIGIYNHIFENIESTHEGPLKNYYAIAVETANDIKTKTFSFDMYMLKSDSYDSLLKSPEFMAIPGIDDEKKHSAIFNFGYQYTDDMDRLKAESTVYHINAYKEPPDGIRVYECKDGIAFDLDQSITLDFISEALKDVDIIHYYIGISSDAVDLYKLAEENAQKENKNENVK